MPNKLEKNAILAAVFLNRVPTPIQLSATPSTLEEPNYRT